MMAVKSPAQTIHLATPDGAVIEGSEALQGTWTAEQYLRLSDHAHRLFEFTDGELELLPTPTDKHQAISKFLLFVFLTHVVVQSSTPHCASGFERVSSESPT
jgi:hypothetical protein